MTAAHTDLLPLSEEACWALLKHTDVGRLAVTAGDGIDIFPVNFLVTDARIYFASGPGSKMLDLTAHPTVAFEADGLTNGRRWSVVVHGRATRLNLDSLIEEPGILDIEPWHPRETFNYVCIEPVTITGRSFRRHRRSA